MAESRLNVVLLNHTQNPEETVSHAARLCYSSSTIESLKEKVTQNDQNLFVNKLISMGHASPFEHISFTFGVEGISRACSHQLVRHRLASFSQQSQRYVGSHSKENKGFDYIIPSSVKEADMEEWFSDKMEEIQKWYDELVKVLSGNGNSSVFEDARFVLPNAIETKIVITMNARELLHFFNVRCCYRAQWEIREMATEMLRISKQLAPNIFKNAGPACVNDKCGEGEMSCGKMHDVKIKFKGL